MKQLFLKSNLLHIRTNEGEYEVSNPDEKVGDITPWLFFYRGGKEWPYGVELVDACPDKGNLLVCANESCWDLEECQHRKVARLIPEEKKAESAYKEFEGKGKLIGHIIDDFKNGKEIFVPAVESSETQEKWEWFKCQSCDGSGRVHRDSLSIVDVSAPSESQEELWREVVEWVRIWPNISTNEVIFHFQNKITLTRKQ